MARYLSESDVYNLLGERGMATVHCSRIDVLPRADVAPRAEFEALKDEADRYKRYYFRHDYDEMIAEAKAEVAREIFEEIKDQLRGIFDFFRQDNDIRESCAIMFAISEVDKIEKKYTQPEPPKGD